ncbi:hypothetical protein BaRGS_00027398 [Batillaria attramentaria]|uniref:Uncharacterized protein n=1 Tax=Batillaria attramentaria TaxID=370345 RepID=A0ABD0K393_9CAEN
MGMTTNNSTVCYTTVYCRAAAGGRQCSTPSGPENEAASVMPLVTLKLQSRPVRPTELSIMHAACEENGGRGDVGWKESYKTAQMVALPDVTRLCGTQAGQLVHDLAQGVGCPEEFIVMPLICCCSALMGPRSEVRVHAAWSEPPVLWIAVGARAGSRKSSALRQVLMPLLTVIDGMKQQQQRRQQQNHCHRTGDEGFGPPAVFTGTLGLPQLRALAEEGAGGVLHVTERAEDSHRRLGIQPPHTDHAARTLLNDLYEAFPGDITTCGYSSLKNSSQSSGQSSPALVTPGLMSHVCFNHCGFAEPEYVVNLVVKSPSWLSGRFLVSCPSLPDNASSASLAVPRPSGSQERGSMSDEASRTEEKSLTLRDLYSRIADTHCRNVYTYSFSEDAVCELQRFQEEEWCTIVAQLGGEEQGGVVSKSLGHIVRLAGVLKALTVAAKSPAAAIQIPSQENEDLDAERNCHEKVVEISVEDVSRAIELGKYFLEQKLSMTFMMLPPLLPGQAGQVGAMTAGPYGLPLGVAAGFSAGQHAMAGVTSAPGHPPPSNPLPQQQQQPHPPFFGGYGAPSAHAIGLHARNVTSSQPATSTPSSATSVDIDVTQLPATWAPTTPEEELAEMSQAAEFVQLEPAQFVAVHARRVKRLLECFDDGCGVSATTAAQKSIAPPVRVAGTNNRHPAWASALFFQKVADLGLGAAEQVRHPTNGRVYWRFKRKTVEELTEKNYQLLQYLRVDMVRFSRLGQPSLHVPGLEADAPSPAGSSGDTVGSGAGVGVIDEAASNSSSKGDKSPCSLESPIKQEVL